MSRIIPAVIALIAISVMGCTPSLPRWKQDAAVILETIRLGGADQAFPAEYQSALDAFRQGEALLQEDEVAGSDEYFRLAWLKGTLLEKSSALEKSRRAEKASRRTREEQHKQERQQTIMEDQRRALLERRATAEIQSKLGKPRTQKERILPLPTFHTVKRGETLPQIAAQADVYNDYRLWPLLYRSNRDQISDPKHILPGQILRIKRNFNREEMTEARHYAQEKPI
jgi:nucleoid-associated protein YgaU